MSNFKPNIIILNAGYSQGSSGGQVIGGVTADPGNIYFNSNDQLIYFYDEGWYRAPSIDADEPEYVGPELDVSGEWWSIWD